MATVSGQTTTNNSAQALHQQQLPNSHLSVTLTSRDPQLSSSTLATGQDISVIPDIEKLPVTEPEAFPARSISGWKVCPSY